MATATERITLCVCSLPRKMLSSCWMFEPLPCSDPMCSCSCQTLDTFFPQGTFQVHCTDAKIRGHQCVGVPENLSAFFHEFGLIHTNHFTAVGRNLAALCGYGTLWQYYCWWQCNWTNQLAVFTQSHRLCLCTCIADTMPSFKKMCHSWCSSSWHKDNSIQTF